MLNVTSGVSDSQSALRADLAEGIPPAPRSLRRFIPVCPPTPAKRNRRGIRQINPPLFETQLPVVSQLLYQGLYDRAGLLGDKRCAYQTSRGQTFPLINASCGSTIEQATD